VNLYKKQIRFLFVKNLILFCLVCFSFSSVISQEDNYDVVYYDYVYYDHLKSVKLSHSGLVTSLPIIDLGQRGALRLSFDDLEGGHNYYSYEVIHCDRNWNPSEIDKIEYIDGYELEDVESVDFSSGTLQNYSHYRITLPNEEMSWTLSGNYILVVYEGDDDDKIPVITRRFMVVEPLLKVGLSVKKPLDVSMINTHHKIEISAYNDQFRIPNPKQELSATVLQNGRWDNAVYNLPPNFEVRNTIQWSRSDQIVFPALKEFRNFDFRSLKYTSEFVHSIDLNKDDNEVVLFLAEKRTFRNFLSDVDADGSFVITNFDFDDPQISSDYANVHFSLESERIFEKEVYVIGAFTDWQARPEFKLEYDDKNSLYFGQARLKQGYYDYMFATEKDGVLESESLEGSRFETSNQYTFLLYYAEFGSRYDRLIGANSITSSFD